MRAGGSPRYILRVTVVAVVIGVIVLLVLSTNSAMRRAQKRRARYRDSLRLLANELDDRYDLVPALIAAARSPADSYVRYRVARELQNGEARIVGAAHVHNDLAQALNETVSTFPSSVFAKLAGVGTVPLFEFAPMLDHVEAADAARSAATTDDAEPGTAAA